MGVTVKWEFPGEAGGKVPLCYDRNDTYGK